MKRTAVDTGPAVVRPDELRADRFGRDLMLIGVVILLVGAKLMLSYWVPGLKTSGELFLSSGLLLITAVSVFRLRARGVAFSESHPGR